MKQKKESQKKGESEKGAEKRLRFGALFGLRFGFPLVPPSLLPKAPRHEAESDTECTYGHGYEN